MTSRTRCALAVPPAAVLLFAAIYAAEPPPSREGSVVPATPAVQKTTRSSTARGPLPDPALLDGSAQKADKQSENGMLGEFELPGDENVRNGTVGGPENANPQSTNDPSLPQNGGSADGTRTDGEPQGAGGQQAGSPPPGAAGEQTGGQPAGAGDPNAKPEGMQVAGLQGDAAGGAAGEQMPQKPPQVAIGDAAMRIPATQNAPNVVGGQVPAGQTQQMEKAVGGGAKGASGGNGNRGAEKGSTMPAGL